MTKLTAGTLSVFLGLVALDADAAVTSKRYVDDAIKAASNELSTTINNLTADGGDVATMIADAVSAEETRATAAEDEINNTIGKIADLETEDKNSIVGAINSLKTTTDGLASGTGLSLGDNSVDTDNIVDGAVTESKIENGAVSTDKLADVVEAGSGFKITYNAKGQVTGSAGLTADDIPTLTADKIESLNKLATAPIPDTCGNEGSYCVLRFDGTNYAWEDVAETYTASVGGDTGE